MEDNFLKLDIQTQIQNLLSAYRHIKIKYNGNAWKLRKFMYCQRWEGAVFSL